MFPTIQTPGGDAVMVCKNYDQNCPTVKVTRYGDVEVGSTLNSRTAFLTEEEFRQLLAHGAGALEQAKANAGGLHLVPQTPA